MILGCEIHDAYRDDSPKSVLPRSPREVWLEDVLRMRRLTEIDDVVWNRLWQHELGYCFDFGSWPSPTIWREAELPTKPFFLILPKHHSTTFLLIGVIRREGKMG